MRSFTVSLALFLTGAMCGAGLAWMKTGPDVQQARRLQDLVHLRDEENDRLRAIVAEEQRVQALGKNKQQREAIEKQVNEIRGLPFKQSVDYAILTRKQIKDVVSGKLSENFTDEEFANVSAALSRLGLLPENYPLRQRYIELLGEQIAAFYDQHQHKLFMFEDATLDNAQNRVVLAHELTHALQDQHFNLLHLPLEIKNNDDRAEASSALVEGEATIVMSDYMMRNLSLRAIKDNLASTFTQNMDQLQKAPRYLRETLVFPYLRGQEFCSALISGGGYGAISEAFANPPSSTTQVLHPAKYLSSPREDPIAVNWPETALAVEKPSADNVLGELGIRIQLSESGDDAKAEIAAAGWRGDRYLSFGKGDALVWKTIWASDQDAAEFFSAETLSLQKRYHLETAETDAQHFEIDALRGISLVRLPGNVVFLVDAPNSARRDELQKRFAP